MHVASYAIQRFVCSVCILFKTNTTHLYMYKYKYLALEKNEGKTLYTLSPKIIHVCCVLIVIAVMNPSHITKPFLVCFDNTFK